MKTNIVKPVFGKKLKGMTLIELLMVLALLGILLSMAIPKLLPLIGRTKSLEAQMQLKHLLSLEKSYFYMHSSYTSDLNELDFEPTKLVSQGGKANYKIEILDANNRGFMARAVSETDFDQDGEFNTWQINHEEDLKEIIKD